MIVETRLRFGGHQTAIKRWWDLEVAIDEVVAELDFKSAQALAVTDRGERAGIDPLAWDVRDNRLNGMIGRLQSHDAEECGGDQEAAD